MTLPVLFIMISNHFPSTFGHSMSWLILGGLILVGVSVRHWFNLKGKGIKNHWLLPFAGLLMISLVIYTSPKSLINEEIDAKKAVVIITDDELMSLMSTHCQSCHSKNPNSEIFAVAPKGLALDTYEEVKSKALLIQAQTLY